jgi:hypothetical protein
MTDYTLNAETGHLTAPFSPSSVEFKPDEYVEYTVIKKYLVKKSEDNGRV